MILSAYYYYFSFLPEKVECRIVICYSKLPADLKEASSLKMFKNKLLTYIHNNETV